MKNKNTEQNFMVSFIKPFKVRSCKNKKGTKSVLVYLNRTTIISLNEQFLKAVLSNKKPQS